MPDSPLIHGLLIVLGLVNTGYIASLYSSDDRFETFMSSNHKAQRWVRWLGYDRAATLTRVAFFPFGAVAGLALIGIGASGLLS